MLQPDIINFSVFISVAIRYMDSAQPEPRVMAFETVLAALKILLQACGRPTYLKAAFDTWAGMSNALIVLERMHFPDLPPETSTSLILPPRGRSLGALLDPALREHYGKFANAIASLNDFLEWFKIQYDVELHSDTFNMLQDTLLILQSCQALIELAPEPVVEPEAPTAALTPEPAVRGTAPAPDPNAPCTVLLPNEY